MYCVFITQVYNVIVNDNDKLKHLRLRLSYLEVFINYNRVNWLVKPFNAHLFGMYLSLWLNSYCVYAQGPPQCGLHQ